MSPSPAQPCRAAQLPGLGDGKAPTRRGSAERTSGAETGRPASVGGLTFQLWANRGL